jgi:hypothetical protein
MSRYSSTTPDGVDNARVAGFKVSVNTRIINASASQGAQDGYDNKSIVATGGDQTYQFTVTNESEVAVRAQLIIDHDPDKCVFGNTEGCNVYIDNYAWEDNAWVYFESNDTVGKTFSVTVNGNIRGHVVDMEVKYEQVD